MCVCVCVCACVRVRACVRHTSHVAGFASRCVCACTNKKSVVCFVSTRRRRGGKVKMQHCGALLWVWRWGLYSFSHLVDGAPSHVPGGVIPRQSQQAAGPAVAEHHLGRSQGCAGDAHHPRAGPQLHARCAPYAQLRGVLHQPSAQHGARAPHLAPRAVSAAPTRGFYVQVEILHAAR